MGGKECSTYININVLWRIAAFIISTVFYISVSVYNKENINLIIFLGMSVSCALSCWLYKKVCENRLHFRIMFSLEVFAYGIFIFLSGGCNSPYLWYEVNCILLMVALDKNITVTFIACIWCLFCAIAGKSIENSSYQDINIILGMGMLMCEFYIIRYYVAYIGKQNEELESLNTELNKEKELSNYAFVMLTELSESFGLFAMTDPKKIMEKLSMLLRNNNLYREFILVKFERDDFPEIIESCGIEKDVYDDISAKVKFQYEDSGNGENVEILNIESDGNTYELIKIGESDYLSGILLRRASELHDDGKDFYLQLIKTVFNNLDTYAQIERYVAVEEQNRIANEIHDTVIQKLFGITCNLAVLESKVKMSKRSIEKGEIIESIQMLKKSVESTMAELRESIYGKRFKDNINTFIHALYAYMEELERLNDVKINLNLDEEADYIKIAQKIALYRVACEAVNNAIKHGKSKNINIELKMESDTVELLIEDDGTGFSREDKNFSEGNGLRNMRNIAVLLKGYLSVVYDDKKGVRVKLSLPR